ncbi:DUF1266 domain-containing protein [Streptomyces pratensis]|uniref:DUF1266 domain-containing protein n=1 Tax=Streptomyces pratensis TaxID=1169025 RepID=UPI0030164009
MLARSRLYVLVPRLHAGMPGWTPPLPTFRDDAVRRTAVPVLTAGLLPPWHPEWVCREVGLGELARIWPYDARRLAVNHSTPHAALVAAGPRWLRAWQKAEERHGGARTGRLLTDSGGALRGPLAHGLALGAHLAVHNGLVWNRLGAVYQDYALDRARLRRPWGIQHRAEFRDRLGALMKNQLVGRVQEAVRRSRQTLATRLGRTPARAEWSEAVGRALAGRDAEDRAEADRAEADRALHRFTRYEERFRADGLLPPDGRVRTTVAYDYGRAVNLARWGLSARYCTPAEAERAIVHAGALSKSAHRSWEEFSSGYALGRVLRFDEEEYGPFYEQCVLAHRLLTESEGSPLRHIPCRCTRPAGPGRLCRVSGPAAGDGSCPGAPPGSRRSASPGVR